MKNLKQEMQWRTLLDAFKEKRGYNMDYKKEIIKMVLSMNNEDYFFNAYHYLFAKYRREKGGAA